MILFSALATSLCDLIRIWDMHLWKKDPALQNISYPAILCFEIQVGWGWKLQFHSAGFALHHELSGFVARTW